MERNGVCYPKVVVGFGRCQVAGFPGIIPCCIDGAATLFFHLKTYNLIHESVIDSFWKLSDPSYGLFTNSYRYFVSNAVFISRMSFFSSLFLSYVCHGCVEERALYHCFNTCLWHSRL